YVATFAPEYYLEVQLAPHVQATRRVADVAGVTALVVTLISLVARWRWHPESAAMVLSSAGPRSRCAFLALPEWESELAAKLGCQSSEGSA
ncbi:MAG: hypothetical protein ACP5G7_04760, partial [Anaerolineae bacterium]